MLPGVGMAITRRPRTACPGRNVAATTRIRPGRRHSVPVRAWRLR